MQKTIQQISDQLLALIKTERPFYSSEQLLEEGIPSYIAVRIQLYSEDKVLDELSDFKSDWIDTENEFVQIVWKQLQSASMDAARIPHSELEDVLISTTSDILSVLVEPRKNMAKYLFREQEILPYAEVEKRCDQLTIYKHFGTAIPMYMKKRNLDELTIQRCEQLIRNLDSRIVANYTPQDWTKKLAVLFTLFRGKLEPKLLRNFFNDKEMDETASLFMNVDHPIDKDEFKNILIAKEEPPKAEPSQSAPEQPKPTNTPNEDSDTDSFKNEANQDDMLNILGDISEGGVIQVDNLEEVDSLNALFVASKESDDDEITEVQKEPEDEDIENFRTNLTSILDQARHSFDHVLQEDDKEEAKTEPIISENDESELIIEDIPQESNSLADNFAENVSAEENSENEPSEIELEEEQPSEEIIVDEDEFGDSSLFGEEDEDESNDGLNLLEKETINDAPIADSVITETKDSSPSEEAEIEENDVDNSGNEEQPMWARFLTQEQMDVIIGDTAEEEEDSRRISFILDTDALEENEEKPIAAIYNDSPQNDTVAPSTNTTLKDFLEPNKKKWIRYIFSNKKKAYAKGVEEIAYFQHWEQASEYLENEIFNHNKVDMFAEETIEFIDELQTYFNEYKS